MLFVRRAHFKVFIISLVPHLSECCTLGYSKPGPCKLEKLRRAFLNWNRKVE
jgi:hypothetical protein